MQEDLIAQKNTKTRLYFIDIARSVAILLMLEGHFISETLNTDLIDPSNTAYCIWKYVRGFTSPIFLTVTGIVFTYLMFGNETQSFFQNTRIRKGIKRSIELLFWGTFLQLFSFHVLHCIGTGILTIITFYGLFKLIKIIPLWVYYFSAGVLLFLSYLFFGSLGATDYWPKNAPFWIQNMFYGNPKYSFFPITPHMGYTMFGAMIGVIFYKNKELVKSPQFILYGLTIGSILFFGSKPFLLIFDRIPSLHHYKFYQIDWLLEKLGMVFIFLSILIAIEKYILDIKKPNLFLRIGQNTLSIYIIHMILLYGLFFIIGITDFYKNKINPQWIIPSAGLFILFFVVFVYYIERLRKLFGFILLPIKKFTNTLFGIAN